MVCLAKVVIGKGAQDVAVGGCVGAVATGGDPHQFSLQLLQLLNAFAHIRQSLGGDFVCPRAGRFRVLVQRQQVTDGRHGQTQIAGVADEPQPFQIRLPIASLVSFRAHRLGQKALFLVVTDGGDLDARGAGQLADRKCHFSLEPIVTIDLIQASREKLNLCEDAMSGCCGHDHNVSFDGMSADYKRRLWAVIVLNGGMFLIEMIAGQAAGSKALQADALDFFGDAVTYGISLAVIGASLRVRATAALAKGVSLFLMGLWVAGSTLYELLVLGVPSASVMSAVGFLALSANLASVFLLARYKDGDANVRSVWLCSRNDAIGNIAVMAAAGVVWWTNSGLPDLLVAGLMSALFLSSAWQILRQGLAEVRSGDVPDHDHGHTHDHDDGHSHSH